MTDPTDKKKKKRSFKKRRKEDLSEEGADRVAGGMQEAGHDDEGAAQSSVADEQPADASSSLARQNKKRRRKNKSKKDGDDANDTTDEPRKKPINGFASINPPLSEGILSAVQSYNFQSMTPVQSAVIPLFLTNKDVCVQAVTGSGKTLAFLIPTIEMILRRTSLLKKRQIGGLIISPTRELARQTYVVATDLCSTAPFPNRSCSSAGPIARYLTI